jgi:hypothetical protein
MRDELDIEQEYEALRAKYAEIEKAYQGLIAGVQKAYEDPETRPHLKKITKKLGIELDDPAYEKQFKEEIEPIKKELEELKAKKIEEEARKKNEEIQELYVKYGITQEELPELQKFIQETGVIPSTKAGWETVLRNFRMSKTAQPTYVRPTLKNKIGEQFSKNPEEALFEAHIQALGARR